MRGVRSRALRRAAKALASTRGRVSITARGALGGCQEPITARQHHRYLKRAWGLTPRRDRANLGRRLERVTHEIEAQQAATGRP